MTSNGALQGLRVVELGHLIAGPFCGQLLGDMGAEVIKVEPPGAGDPMRQWGRAEVPLWWEVIGRNKKSVTIDLRNPAGRELLLELIDVADVVIENFRPGTLESWGLGPDVLAARNPRLIVTRVSGFGQTGPYASRPGFGGIGEAMGGWRYVVGEPDRPPSRMGIAIGDSLAGTFGCMGTLAALEHRHKTGRGQVVDASLYESVLQMMESLVVDYSVTGAIRERSGSALPGIAPSNVYRCQDGEILIGANQDGVFARLCAAMGRPELATDPRFDGHRQRGRNERELDGLIGAWTATMTVADVEALALQHAVPVGRMYRAPEMLADPHYQARRSLIERVHPRHGRFYMQNAFPFLSESPSSVRTAAPERPGMHNDEVFAGLLRRTPQQLDQLQALGAI